MADPAAGQLTGRVGGCCAALLLLACSGDPAAPGAIDDDPRIDPAAPATPVTMPSFDSGATDAVARPAADAGPPPNIRRVSLIDHDQWMQLGPEDDPFEDRPDDFACAAGAVAAEELAGERAYGVDTGRCSYVTARQVAATHAAAGETLIVRLWHFALTAPNPGEAHAVIDVDGLRVLDERVPIPSPGGLIKVTLPIERPIDAGASVHFHLHNHGENSWALVEVSTGP